MVSNATDILKSKSLRITECRLAILRYLIREDRAVSHQELETELSADFDRVTIYRTLHTFLEHDIIHQVLDSGLGAKYALCKTSENGEHVHNHVHFKCLQCESIVCLTDTLIPVVELPLGFTAKEWNILAQGICNKCQGEI